MIVLSDAVEAFSAGVLLMVLSWVALFPISYALRALRRALRFGK